MTTMSTVTPKPMSEDKKMGMGSDGKNRPAANQKSTPEATSAPANPLYRAPMMDCERPSRTRKLPKIEASIARPPSTNGKDNCSGEPDTVAAPPRSTAAVKGTAQVSKRSA